MNKQNETKQKTQRYKQQVRGYQRGAGSEMGKRGQIYSNRQKVDF